MKHRNGPQKNVVGAQLRRIRQQSKVKITQEDIAGRLAALGLEIDRASIVRIEAGQRYVLDYEASLIAKALRVPIQELFPKS